MEGNPSNGVRKVTTKSEITVDSVGTTEFQKEGTKTAQLRQVVTTKSYYPSKQIATNLQDNMFDADDFGFQEQVFTQTENRVAFVDVPQIISSTDDVLAKIPSTATLYRMLSNKPILTSAQAYAIDQGLKTMDDFANSQVVRYSEGHEKAGQLTLDANGKPQYRKVFFSKTAKEDVDMRTSQAEDFYASAQIKGEMTQSAAHVVQGQAL